MLTDRHYCAPLNNKAFRLYFSHALLLTWWVRVATWMRQWASCHFACIKSVSENRKVVNILYFTEACVSCCSLTQLQRNIWMLRNVRVMWWHGIQFGYLSAYHQRYRTMLLYDKLPQSENHCYLSYESTIQRSCYLNTKLWGTSNLLSESFFCIIPNLQQTTDQWCVSSVLTNISSMMLGASFGWFHNFI